MTALQQSSRLRGPALQLVLSRLIEGAMLSPAAACAANSGHASTIKVVSAELQSHSQADQHNFLPKPSREPLRWHREGRSVAAGAAAAVALLGCAASAALCEGASEPETSDQYPEAAANADVLSNDALMAKATLARMWRGVSEALLREEEGLPAFLPKRKVPQIGTVHGRTSVIIPLRPGVDPYAVMKAVATFASAAAALQKPQAEGHGGNRATGNELHFQMSEGGFTLEDADGRPLPEDRLHVHVKLPTKGAGGHRAQLQFLKSGRLTDDDVAVIGDAMRRANNLRLSDTPFQVPEELLDGLFREGLESFFPGGEQMLWQLGDAVVDMGRRLDSMRQLQDPEAEDDTGQGRLPPLPPPPRHWQSSPEAAHPGARGDAATLEHDWGSPEAAQAVTKLQGMGCVVHPPGNQGFTDWGVLQGYEEQKGLIEEGLLLPLQHPEVFEAVTKGTRRLPGSSRPRAVLFEGPPGTGKTTAARIIATQAAVPLVYVPLEALGSKWYGASEKMLASVFLAAQQLNGAIVFFDEIDSLATSRGGDMHEATRKMLGVLLREMDGFDSAKKSIVIGATNRSSDLDPALLSRFDTSIMWPLPDESCRAAIMHSYAQQLTEADVARLAAATPGASGRDLRDIACRTERAWGAKIARGEIKAGGLPLVDQYMVAAEAQQQKVQAAVTQGFVPHGGSQRLVGGPPTIH